MPCDVISTRWRKLQRNNRFLFHFVLFVFIFSAGLTSARFGSQNSGSIGYKNTNRTVVGNEHWSLRREKIKMDCKWPQSMNSIRKNKGRENDKPRRKKSWLRTENGWQLGTENFEIFLIFFFYVCVCVSRRSLDCKSWMTSWIELLSKFAGTRTCLFRWVLQFFSRSVGY